MSRKACYIEQTIQMEELPNITAMISTKAVATGDRPWPNGPSQSAGRVSVVNSFCAVAFRLHAVP